MVVLEGAEEKEVGAEDSSQPRVARPACSVGLKGCDGLANACEGA